MVNAITAEDIAHSWAKDGTPFRVDVLCLILALAIHVPLYFLKIDASKSSVDRSSKERLVSVDLLETLVEEKEPVAPPQPAEPAKPNLMDKLKMLVKKEPPPPAPVVQPKPVEPAKLQDVPKPIELQAKLNTPPPDAAKLQSKAGFQTQADPKLVENKQLALNAPAVGIAPLSAKKLGTIDDRSAVKQDRGNFQVKSDALSSIDDGKGPGLAGAAAAPAIAIRTGNSGSVEKFSAPVTQKTDKGRIGAVPAGNLGSGPQLGLRDSIIARDAAPTQIGGSAPSARPAVSAPLASKQDAGRFQGGSSAGTGLGAGVAAPVAVAPIAAAPSKPKEKKSMFSITGPLKDRTVLKQVAPEYPAWAQAQGIEASVVLEFTVDSSGKVKPNVVVRRTSGYPKLDDTAIQALRQWQFAPLADVNRDEVGLITFNYSLN